MTREEPFERVDIIKQQTNPLILEVTSDNNHLATRTAYLLAEETNGKIADNSDLIFKDYNFLKNSLGEDFDLLKAKNRFDKSIYGQTTLENPYPK